ncbi:hypothetical protein JHK87_019300 [Glycine soja]|nr:hypothetical protein JHK87_019300 [Glycine soja]
MMPRRVVDRRPTPIEEVKELEIAEGKKVKIDTTLISLLEDGLLKVLKRNSNVFAWCSSDMLEIDPNFLCHKLALNPSTKPMIHKRRKLREEKMKAITKETNKLIFVDHVREIQYPTRWSKQTFDFCVGSKIEERPHRSTWKGILKRNLSDPTIV